MHDSISLTSYAGCRFLGLSPVYSKCASQPKMAKKIH